MHPHIPRPRRKATRTCTDTAGVVRTVHGEFMWPFTARVNEKTAPIERIAAVAICRRLSPRCASQQNRTFNVRFGSEADMTRLLNNVRFTPQSGQTADILACPLCAISRQMAVQQIAARSITNERHHRSRSAGGLSRVRYGSPSKCTAGGVVPYAEQQPRLAGATVEQN